MYLKFIQIPSTLPRGNLKMEVSLRKRIKCLLRTLGRRNLKTEEITWLSWRHRFRKAPFSKCFPFTLKRTAGVFKFLRFEELRFRDGLVWTVGLTVEIKLRFQLQLMVYIHCSFISSFLRVCCFLLVVAMLVLSLLFYSRTSDYGMFKTVHGLATA